MVAEAEIAASVLQPHFDAVRDEFAAFCPVPGRRLSRLDKVRFLIDEQAREGPSLGEECLGGRHFAGTSDTGLRMIFAPEIVQLPFETLVAVLAHEFGHSADFAYPGAWAWPRVEAGEAVWVGEDNDGKALAWRAFHGKVEARSVRGGDDTAPSINWMKAWQARDDDQIEWAADGIAFAVTGKRIGYAGACMLQSFDERAMSRPRGLR